MTLCLVCTIGSIFANPKLIKTVNMAKDKKEQEEVWAQIFLPNGTSGVFEWQKKSYALVSGPNTLKFPIQN